MQFEWNSSVSIGLLHWVTTAVHKLWDQSYSTGIACLVGFFSIFFFLNFLDSVNNWWAISDLPKLLQPALTMQFRVALHEAGNWWWMYSSLTLIILSLIHSLVFVFISCCQCVCQTLLNVLNRCPVRCPVCSRATCVRRCRWSVCTTGPCTRSPHCAGLSRWGWGCGPALLPLS